LRRIWSGRTLRTAFLVVLGILLIQVAVGALIPQVRQRAGTNAWVWAMSAASMLGLHAQWTTTLLQGLGLQPGSTPRFIGQPLWLMVPLGIAGVIVQMLLPAFAAMSIAPDRENRRLDELVLAGFTPGQLLFAKGAAALLPLVGLWLVTHALNTLMWFLFARHPVSGLPATLMPEQGLVPFLLTLVGFLARSGSLVCLSALCRRYHTAMQGCYAFAFVLFPLLQSFAVLPFVMFRPVPNSWPAYFLYVPTALAVGCFVVLLRPALRALAEPGEPHSSSRSPAGLDSTR
jgi:hypothetical protein